MDGKWNFYTTKEIKPGGWLRRQLKLQADGLCGNLHKVYRDIRDSAWIGGDAEGWERVPYWLDGFIPLAYLLEDEEMIAVAKKYIDAIVASQREDGWICPCSDDKRSSYDTWAVQLITKVLYNYYTCSGDERIPGVIYKALKNYYDLLKNGTVKLFKWGKIRWYETFIAINFIYENCKEEWLCELAEILRAQGTNPCDITEKWKVPIYEHTMETHIVNIAMLLKYEAVSHGILGEKYNDKAEFLREILDKYNGTPVGSFTGDECLAGLSPVHGTELCAIVEQMYSYELLYAHTGDSKWAERLELLAFNALPAAISDDMWAHQYDQLSNQISCERFPGRPIFMTNNGEAHLFGLEPNVGCCTTNHGQGWPKFTLSAFMHNDTEVINVFPLPTVLDCDKAEIEVETDYPFENKIKYKIFAKKDFDFKIRIPSFAKNVTVCEKAVDDAGELSFSLKENETREFFVSFFAEPHFIDRPYELKTVRCGSLLFSVPIKYEKVMLEYERNGVERKFPYCDYEYIGKSDWNWAYCGDTFRLEHHTTGDVPFSSENPPVTIKTDAVKINWGFEFGYKTVCAKEPETRLPVSVKEEIILYPYGAAKLRMTELPLIELK